MVLAERQYSKPLGKDHGIPRGKALEHSPWQWSRLIESGPPRQLMRAAPSKADIVIFTAGSFRIQGGLKLVLPGSVLSSSIEGGSSPHSSPKL